jgi:hypothetical protein
MTRLVVAFFLCITFLLTVTWIVPGAKPPEMMATAPAALQKQAPSPRIAIVEPSVTQAPEPSRPAAAEARPAAAAPVAAPPRTAQASACDGDPIRCMLEGRAVPADPTEVTGSVVAPRKPTAKPAAHHPAKP